MFDIVVSVNEQKLKRLLSIYRDDFSEDRHWRGEIYKWFAVKHFQDVWQNSELDFSSKIINALSKTDNLLAQSNYYPRAMINEFAKKEPEDTEELFALLKDPDVSTLIDKIKQFKDKAEIIKNNIKSNKKLNHYQTNNSITTYLWLMYPNIHYIYKYSVFENLVRAVDAKFDKPKADNVEKCYALYNKIREILMNDIENCKDSKTMEIIKKCGETTGFYDNELHLFISDFAYFVNTYMSLSRNLIFFGAPGTGKSYILNKELNKFVWDKNREYYYERVTFYPDYTYANFVGSYKPVSDDNGEIKYKFVPGPFIRILKNALEEIKKTDKNNNGKVEAVKEPYKPFVLVIEEINRANPAAIFGEMFQLLDRRVDDELDKEGKNVIHKKGESEYPIDASEELKEYLKGYMDNDKIIIPSNMYIWATMNSADQGVYPMDTAFKRRWDFKYIDIDNGEEDIAGKHVCIGGKPILWNKLRKAINERLVDLGINEDKLLGAHFIKSVPEVSDNEYNSELFCEVFKDKVLMYLFEDAARYKRKELFADEKDAKQYSKLCKSFDEKGIEIFCKEIADNKEILYSKC